MPPLAINEAETGEDENGEIENVSTDESEFVCGQIEEMADRFHAGESPNPADFEFWKWELFVFWRKTEREFERNIQYKLGVVADSFFK